MALQRGAGVGAEGYHREAAERPRLEGCGDPAWSETETPPGGAAAPGKP